MVKPKVILFRPPIEYIPKNNHHVLYHKIVKSLDVNFDVTIAEKEVCDIPHMLEQYEPDIVIFQFVKGLFDNFSFTGIDSLKNTLKLGLVTIDHASALKAHFIKMMQKYDISYVFAIALGMGYSLAELRNYIYYYPHFIDSKINNDYGLEKIVPVLLTGNFGFNKKQYLWRKQIESPIKKTFPFLHFGHPGYKMNNINSDILHISGQKYFKTINSSWITPTSGGFRNQLVMKHLEIPGSRSCLVCKPSSNVEAYGFKDMENCVFSEPDEIVEKFNWLFENPDELQRITDNGYNLVHSRHSENHRPQIYQWYQLMKQKKPGQKIIQPSLFGDLELVDEDSPRETVHIKGGLDIEKLTQADKFLAQGKYASAEKLCLEVVDYAEYIYDAKLRLYFIYMMYRGTKPLAYQNFRQLFFFGECSLLYDPVHLSIIILHLLIEGKTNRAAQYAKVSINRRRKELDYVRLLAFKKAKAHVEFAALKNEILKYKDNKDLKTMYYFYEHSFQLMDLLEKIAIKYLRGTTKLNKLLEVSIEQKQEKTDELLIQPKEFSEQEVKKDLLELERSVTRKVRLIKRLNRFRLQ